MKFLQFILLLLLPFTTNCQELAGIIVDHQTKEPIGYANIAIIRKGIGTVADGSGIFTIRISKDNLNDTLTVSAIGYERLIVNVNDMLNIKRLDTLWLSTKYYEIPVVSVKPVKYKIKFFGNKGNNKNIKAKFENDELGYEIGVNFSTNDQIRIQSLNLSIAECTYDSVFLRLNVYEKDSKENYRNILASPIYLTLQNTEIKKNVIIDLSSKNINISGDCLVTLEHIKYLGEGSLWLSASLFSNSKTLYRKTSLAPWQEIPFGIGIGITVKASKQLIDRL
jgi:hypothetical protein